jgi:hypothetical protein
MTVMKATFEDGRETQFQEMMQQLTLMQAKYKGVRGELLAKVREELERLKPVKPGLRVAPPPPPTPAAPTPAPVAAAPAQKVTAKLAPEKILPSCRVCGRGMKLSASNDGSLVCERGHTRPAKVEP